VSTEFVPKTESELKPPLFPKGEYDFTVIGAEEKKSARGNTMLVLNLMITDGGEGKIAITDYLVANRPLKLRNAALACGLDAEYRAGKLTEEDFLERSGRLKLAVKKDPDGVYPDQNLVTDYVVNVAKPRGVAPNGGDARQVTLEDALARFSSKGGGSLEGRTSAHK
jgi:hypothetical protein